MEDQGYDNNNAIMSMSTFVPSGIAKTEADGFPIVRGKDPEKVPLIQNYFDKNGMSDLKVKTIIQMEL